VRGHHDTAHARCHLGRLGGDGVIAAHQYRWHAVVCGERGVQAKLAQGAAIAAHVSDDAAGDGVGHDRAGRAGLAVIADEEHRVHVFGQPRHHSAGLGRAAQQLGTPVERFGEQVPEIRVGLGDQHLGAGLVGVDAADGGVGLRRQLLAVTFVFAVAGLDIVAVDHCGDSFHVDRDQHPHAISRLSSSPTRH
jgi:hypothetical protein